VKNGQKNTPLHLVAATDIGDGIINGDNEPSQAGTDTAILNLASKEYSAVAGLAVPRLSSSGKKVITVHFKQESGGGLRTISMHAKMARGHMLRHILMECLKSPLPLKEVEVWGHRFRPELSSETEWVFILPKEQLPGDTP
jgi:cytoplasmic iron level regulating protein YaaA (DUF328/UPF0246 family)